MHRNRLSIAAGALVLALSPAACFGQSAEPLQVGNAAPEFEIPGATRAGITDEPVRLGDYRGQAVVLAFFYKVRTPG